MKINELVKEICKREGLKKSVDVAQVREIVGHISDIFLERSLNSEEALALSNELYKNGVKRAKKKKP